MKYEIRFKPSAAREFAKLARDARQRIAPKLDALAANPRPPGAEKLTGVSAWRIRVGDHRIVYAIEHDVLIVLVLHVGNRRDVYKRLRE